MYKLAQRDFWTGRVDSETDSSQFRHFQTVNFRNIKDDYRETRQGVGFHHDLFVGDYFECQYHP